MVRFGFESGEVIRIDCTLCTNHLTGHDANKEWKAMTKEAEINILGVSVGKPAEYRTDARFVVKIIPDMRRDKARTDAMMKAVLRLPRREKGISWITRNDVPGGHAGFLYLQAKLLAAGARSLPQELAINRWDEIESIELLDLEIEKNDRSGLHIKTELVGSSRTNPDTWEMRAGAIMMRAMMAAFSCEIALKAILMTRNHRARKTHDLFALYTDLPGDCRARMKGDYEVIGDVLEKSRRTFDKWRYFEDTSSTKMAAERVLNHEIAQDLEKAARVIVDECVMVGLKGELYITGRGSWTARLNTLEEKPSTNAFQEGVHFKVDSGESAIDWPN